MNLVVPNMYGPYDSINPNKTHALNALVIKFVKAVGEEPPRSRSGGPASRSASGCTSATSPVWSCDVIEARERLSRAGQSRAEQGLHGDRAGGCHSALSWATTGRIVYNTKYQDGSPKKVMDDQYFRQRFPDFEFTTLEAGIARTVEYYQGIL